MIACLHGGTGGSRLTGDWAGHAQIATDRGALFVSETWQKHRSARRGRSSTLMSSWIVCSLPLNGTAVHPPPPLLCRAYPVLHRHAHASAHHRNRPATETPTFELLLRLYTSHHHQPPTTSVVYMASTTATYVHHKHNAHVCLHNHVTHCPSTTQRSTDNTKHRQVSAWR